MIKMIMNKLEKCSTGSFVISEHEETNITFETYRKIIEAIPFFRALGGTEILKGTDKHKVLTSISPSGNVKIIREFTLP